MLKDSTRTIEICETVAKISIYILVFLLPIFFLPWTLNLLDFNKQTLLIILVFAALFAFSIRTLIAKKISFRVSFFHIAVLVLLLVYLVSTVFSLWRYGSFWGWPQHVSDNLLNIICFVLLYFLVINVFSKKEIFNLFLLLVASGFLTMILGVLQLIGKYLLPFYFTKTVSFNTIGSVNSLGIFAAVLLPLIIVLAANTKKLLRVFLIVALIIDFVLLALVNFSVIWWLVIIGSALIIIFGMQKTDLFDNRWIALPMFFLTVSLLFIFFNFRVPGLPARPIEVFLGQRASFDIAKEVLKENALFGSGPGTFIYDFSKYKNIQLNEGSFWNIRLDNAGSEILSNLSTIGILGVVSILFLIGFFVFLGIRFIVGWGQRAPSKGGKKEGSTKEEPTKGEVLLWSLGLGIFVSFLVLSASRFLYFSNLTMDFVYFLLIGGFLAISSSKKEFLLKSSSLATLGVTFIFTLIFIFGLGLFIMQGQRYIAEADYLKGLKTWQEQKTDESLGYLEKSAGLNPKVDFYWRELSQVYLTKIREEAARKDLPQEQINQRIQSLINSAVNSSKIATDINPKNVANWSIRGFVYQNLIGIVGETDYWANKCYDEAIALEPNNPYFPAQKGIGLLTKAALFPTEKKEEKAQTLLEAKSYFEKAIGLKSDYSPARFQLAMVYQAENKTEEAIKALEDTKQYAPFDTGLAFQIGLLYYQNKDYQKAQAELERAIGINPDYSNALYFLGLVYDRQGQKTKAIEKFQKVAELNPDNQEVKKILENLNKGKGALEGIVQEVPPETPIEETPPERLPKK